MNAELSRPIARLWARQFELADRLDHLNYHATRATLDDDGTTDYLRVVTEGELDLIDAALERLAVGSYGTCERCGDVIETERLDLLPETAVCRACART
jgi:RNA polymerase-binding transcription factor DksA